MGDANNGIMIDCGVTCKRVCEALSDNGISEDAVKGIFITHTHSDHIKGLKVFLKKHRVPIYAQQKNLDILFDCEALPEGTVCYAIDGSTTEIGGFTVDYFVTPHDTPASCGYRVVYPEGKVACLCTDLGCVTETVWQSLTGADLIMLESNYDPDMLKFGSYAPALKSRISSEYGHLSNNECGYRLSMLAEQGTMNFILGHLSEENNTPQKAEQSAVCSLSPRVREQDYLLYVAPPSGGRAVVF